MLFCFFHAFWRRYIYISQLFKISEAMGMVKFCIILKDDGENEKRCLEQIFVYISCKTIVWLVCEKFHPMWCFTLAAHSCFRDSIKEVWDCILRLFGKLWNVFWFVRKWILLHMTAYIFFKVTSFECCQIDHGPSLTPFDQRRLF